MAERKALSKKIRFEVSSVIAFGASIAVDLLRM